MIPKDLALLLMSPVTTGKSLMTFLSLYPILFVKGSLYTALREVPNTHVERMDFVRHSLSSSTEACWAKAHVKLALLT